MTHLLWNILLIATLSVIVSCDRADDDTGLESGDHPHNTPFNPDKPVLFVLGASKTGTSELAILLRQHIGNCCHNCEKWWEFTDPAQIKYNCYADNGDYANFKMFNENMPNPRFILNTRMVKPWIKSMHRHISGVRTRHNCSVTGTKTDCHYKGWVSNSKSNLEWRVKSFLKSADSAERYFRDKKNLVVVRLEDSATSWPIGLAKALQDGPVVPLEIPSKGYSWSAAHSINATDDSATLSDWIHKKYCILKGKELSEFQCWAFCSLYEHTCTWSPTAWYTNISAPH